MTPKSALTNSARDIQTHFDSDPASASGFQRKTLWWGCFACALYLLFLTASTRSTFFGDTPDYVNDIASTLEGQKPFVSLLDFGHLTWRPIGALVTGTPNGRSDQELKIDIATNLIRINIVASLVCGWATWILLCSVTGMRTYAAALTGAAMLTANGFVVLSRAGTAWLPGLACVLSGCCFAVYASRRQSLWLAMCAALLTAFAALLWIPFTLAAPMVSCAGLLAYREENAAKRVLWSSVRLLPIAAVLTIGAYAAAIYMRHIISPAEFLEWMRSATHGEGRDRQLLRMFFGLPRSFLIAGDDGVLWKQFLFHDPYAGVNVTDVFKASLWRLGVFYAAAGTVLVELLRLRWKQRDATAAGILLWLFVAAVPTLALALAFEAGSVERYLPLYGAFFVASAWVVSQPRANRLARIVLVCFCSVLMYNNLYANWRTRVDKTRAQTLARLGQLQFDAIRPLVIYTINVRDELLGLYDPNNRSFDFLPPISLVIPSTAGDVANWKNLFGKRALKAWAQGGEVWVSKRCWADRPLRRWLWVEGDDHDVHWKDIPRFVSRFQPDANIGGPDGFYRLGNNSANRETADALSSDPSLR